MSDPTITPPPAGPPGDPVCRSSLTPNVYVRFAHPDAAQVRPAVEAMREGGMRVLAVSDTDPIFWGQDIERFLDSVFPSRYPVAVVFVSKHYGDSPHALREVELLLARAGEDMRQGLVVPVRLDDSPPPGPVSRLMSLDYRAFPPGEFAAEIRKRVAAWTDAHSAEPTEEELLDRYRLTGDRRVLDDLLLWLYPDIVERVRARWKGEVNPADIAVRTFRVLTPRLRDPIPHGLSCRAYAYLTANRIAADLIRERRKPPVADTNDSAPADPPTTDEAKSREAVETVRAALDRLPATEREVVEAITFGGATLHEVATRLGLSAASIHSQFRRGLHRLREYLAATSRG